MKRIFLFALALAAGAAAAQTPVRVDPAAAPACDAASVECAVAQFFFCAASHDAAACAALGLQEAPKFADTPQPVEFLLERVGTIDAKDITDDLKHLAWFKAGFVLVEAQARRCPGPGSCADEQWDDWQIYLRPDDGRLQIVYWRGDSEPDQPPDIPETFRTAPPGAE